MPIIQVPEISVRVMSLNMQYGAGPEDRGEMFLEEVPKKELEHNIDSIVNLIYEVNPDIICLQEVDRESGRTYFMDQLGEITKRLAKKQQCDPYNAEFGSCVDFDEKKDLLSKIARPFYNRRGVKKFLDRRGFHTDSVPKKKIRLHFGNATMTRDKYPIREKNHFYFIPPYWNPLMTLNIMLQRDERKSLLVCRVNYFPEIEDKIPLYVFNTHFDSSNEKNRRIQSEFMYRLLNNMQDSHNIVAGDFNETSMEGSLKKFLSHPGLNLYSKIHLSLAENPELLDYATYPSKKPSKTYDLILASNFIEMIDYYVHTRRVADHLAVVSELKIKPNLVLR